MAITKLERDFNIVSALDNEPNDVSGMTADDLKAKFDEGNKAIQTYINETLIPETEASVDAVRAEIDGAVAGATEDLEAQLRGVVLGQIPNGTITEEKLDPDFVNSQYSKDEIISTDTKDKFGLPETATPDDAFEKLANVSNQYVWHKTKTTEWYDQIVSNPFSVSICTYNNVAYTIRYADSVSVDADGKAVLVEPITAATYSYATFDSVVGVAAIRGKYITTESEDTIASYGEGAVFYIPHDATSSTSNNRSIYVGCQWVKYEYHSKTEDFGYVSSPLFDDYPPIKPDGFDYAYVGKTPESANLIGDVKVTIRNDLGEKWLPCDGQVFDVGEYPDLPKLLPEPNTLTSMAQTNIPANFYGADYANGICVSFGNRANSSGTYRWVGSLDGLNQYQTVSGNSSNYHTVQYDKGSDTWVSACYESNTAYSYATKDPVNGTWEQKTISTMSNKYDHICGHNGLWVAIGSQSSRDNSRNVTSSMWISTTTDPINGEWSAEKKIGDRGSGNHDYASIHYHNGIWVIVTEYEESASAGGGYGVATYTTTDPVNGTWTKREIWGGTQSKYVYGLQAHEGTWVMPIYDGYNCYLYTTTDPVNGEWSASPTFTFKAGSATYSNPFFITRCIRWHLGKWYVLASASTNNGQVCFLASTDNNGETWSAIDMGINYGRSLCTDGKILIAQTTNGTSSNSAKYLAYKLPKISVENANTFIKAKM